MVVSSVRLHSSLHCIPHPSRSHADIWWFNRSQSIAFRWMYRDGWRSTTQSNGRTPRYSGFNQFASTFPARGRSRSLGWRIESVSPRREEAERATDTKLHHVDALRRSQSHRYLGHEAGYTVRIPHQHQLPRSRQRRRLPSFSRSSSCVDSLFRSIQPRAAKVSSIVSISFFAFTGLARNGKPPMSPFSRWATVAVRKMMGVFSKPGLA